MYAYGKHREGREREDNSELEAQVDEIMQTVFGDDDPYIYGDSEDD